MTQTLRRELRLKFSDVLSVYLKDSPMPESEAVVLVEDLINVVLELRGFSKPVVDLKNSDIAWSILAGEPVEQEQIDTNILSKNATDDFERELHFNPLPWDSNKEWEKFRRFVVNEYARDTEVWKKYNNWRQAEGQYKGAMTNPKIYQRPNEFMAASYPAFLAHTSMYPKRTTRKSQRLNND